MIQVGRFRPGDRVRVVPRDVSGHTRAPRYVRGQVGTVVEQHGTHAVPDVVVADGRQQFEPVYAIRFVAGDLFGVGDHGVTVNLWESYLEAART